MGDGQIVNDSIVIMTPDGEVLGFSELVKDIHEIKPIESEDETNPALQLSLPDFSVSLTGTLTEYSHDMWRWFLYGEYPKHIQTVVNGKPSRKLKWCRTYAKVQNRMFHSPHSGRAKVAMKNLNRRKRMYKQAKKRWGGMPIPPEWKEKDNANKR